jgi:hypothetical protein
MLSALSGHWRTIATAAGSGLVTAVPAAWILFRFLLRREAEPGAELNLDVDFVGRQDGQWLIEVVAKLTNKGAVRHEYSEFRVVVRYLLPGEKITDGPDKTNYQLLCNSTINDRIGGRARYYANASFIDPGLTFRHSYVTFVPENATFLLVQLKLVFTRRDSWRPWKKIEETKNTQRLIAVPKDVLPSQSSG